MDQLRVWHACQAFLYQQQQQPPSSGTQPTSGTAPSIAPGYPTMQPQLALNPFGVHFQALPLVVMSWPRSSSSMERIISTDEICTLTVTLRRDKSSYVRFAGSQRVFLVCCFPQTCLQVHTLMPAPLKRLGPEMLR